MTTLNHSIPADELVGRLGTADAPRILDVRTPGEFASSHIPGAVNIPLDSLAEHAADLRDHDQEVVLVCRSGSRAMQARDLLDDSPLDHLRVLEGGMQSWQGTGGRVVRREGQWDLERQVRLVAGSIVASSILASTVVPRAKWLAGGIGGGLVYAAVSNTCAMGTMLQKMPWNKGRTCDLQRAVQELSRP